MKKRTVATIKQYDYRTKEDYENDIPAMKQKGYLPLNTTEFYAGTIVGSDEEYKFTAYFIKSDMM